MSDRGALRSLPCLLLVAILAAFALASLSSCAARVSARIGAAREAELSVTASLPPILAAKLRSLPGAAKGVPLFDLAAVRAALLARPGLHIKSLSNPDQDSLAFSIAVDDLGRLLASPEFAGPGLLRLVEAPGESELILHFERGRGAAVFALAPGLDQDMIDALSPPAMDEGDFTKAEYREMLGGILPAKAVAELDAAAVECSITFPADLVATVGGTAKGPTWTFSLPILDLLVLEKPLDLRARWKR